MRTTFFLSVLAVLLCVSFGTSDSLKPLPLAPKEMIRPMSTRVYRGLYKADQSASVQLFGSGDRSLLLYVFDTNGNCVAWDDNITRPQFCDELATEWIADADGRYSVEIRNVGFETHEYSLAIR